MAKNKAIYTASEYLIVLTGDEEDLFIEMLVKVLKDFDAEVLLAVWANGNAIPFNAKNLISVSESGAWELRPGAQLN